MQFATRSAVASSARIATIIVLGLIVVLNLGHPLNPDVAWFMSVAQRMLDGQLLYVDLIDINPPLIAYLMMPPVVLSELMGLGPAISVNLVTLLLIAASMALSIGPLCSPSKGAHSAYWWILTISVALITLPVLDFGQREHLLVVLVLPYIVVQWRRIAGHPIDRPRAFLVGAMAGLGFCIKPYFVPMWLSVELVAYLAGPRFTRYRPATESVIIAVVLGIYALFSIVVHHEYFSLMRSAAPVYDNFGPGRVPVVKIVLAHLLPLAPILLALRATQRETKLLVALLVAFCIANALMAILQAKGWRYHVLPGLISIALIAGALFEDHFRAAVGPAARGQRGLHFLAFGTLAIGSVLLAAPSFRGANLMRSGYEYIDRRAAILETCSAKTVLVLGDVVVATSPMLNYAQATSVSPFASMWWLRSLYGNGRRDAPFATPSEMAAAEKRFYDLLVRKFVKSRPNLIMVDRSPRVRFGDRAFPYLDYFAQDAAFATAMESYDEIGQLDQYQVWRRTTTLAPDDDLIDSQAARVEGCPIG